MSEKLPLVDVEKVLREKAHMKRPSKLLVWFLKKIIHQDQINTFLINHPSLKGLDFLEEGLKYLQVKIEVDGIENVDKSKRYVFASNHPLGGLDGMSMGYYLGKQFDGKIKFPANDLLMNLTPLHSLFMPINKHGGLGKKSTEIFNATFESDCQILIYPAGFCSRWKKGEICDIDWKKTFVTKAIQYQRDIVPVYFNARNSTFFYILALIRKALGIKINIEMLFLADEMFKQKNNTFKATIGKPIAWQELDKSKTSFEWAQYIKGEVYNLKK